MRDSAGVTIVEHAGDLWSTPLRWRTSAEPVLRVGELEGDEAYLFDGIVSLAVLDDGRFIVANQGDQSLRWFDPNGRFIMERGGAGEGPGEFSRVGDLTVTGDSVVATDWSGLRFTMFDLDGNIGRSTRITGLTEPPSRLYRIPSGDWILGTAGFGVARLGPEVTDGIHRYDEPLLRVNGDGSGVDTLVMLPGTEIQITTRGEGFMMTSAPLGRVSSYTVLGDELIAGTADQLRFDVYSAAGALTRSVRAPDVNLALTPEIETAYLAILQERVEQMPEEVRPEAERSLAEMELPRVLPAYSSIQAGADSTVWVGSYRVVPGWPQHALVFDAAGEFLGRVELPPSLRVMWIGDGYVWGRESDELGVEYVVKYRLEDVASPEA
ncbi:MAG TPA: 6-bladed beta-propeller [Longimicrobiales bacterium]|nr:6-bladed beta-propeller [Longimicrobiales bacterium]